MHRPSPAMIVALLALFVALSGTAVAAKSLITKSSQIKNGVIESSDLRDGRGVNVRDITPAARRALRGAAGAAGALGPAGPAGAQGAPGSAGEAGPAGPKGDTGTVDTSGFYDKAASDSRFVNDDETAFDSARLAGTPSQGWTYGTFGPINNNSSASSVNQIAYGRRVLSAESGQPVVGVDGIGDRPRELHRLARRHARGVRQRVRSPAAAHHRQRGCERRHDGR